MRSSATGEDGADASFAGMNATFTNVCGEQELIDAVQRCWASLFSPRVVTHRASRKFTTDPAMAVVVQVMIASERAGVAFTADQHRRRGSRHRRGGIRPRRSGGVSGSVEPDTYVVDKITGEILSQRMGYKNFKIVRGADGSDRNIDPSDGRLSRRCSDEELRRSSRWHSSPNGTTVAPETPSGPSPTARSGWCRLGRSPRCITPPCRRPMRTLWWPVDYRPRRARHWARCEFCSLRQRAADCATAAKYCRADDESGLFPTMRRAAALVTDTGGMTCHAAIVARELGGAASGAGQPPPI